MNIQISRELAERVLSCAWSVADPAMKELRALLAAPVVERKPVPFIIGNRYSTQAGEIVRFVGVHNEGTSYETMEDEQGVNRYTRRDFGRVTGSPHDYSEPRNTPPLYTSPPAPVAVPDGWKLVPIEPTELMISRGGQSFNVAKSYAAMIEAAPCLPRQGQGA